MFLPPQTGFQKLNLNLFFEKSQKRESFSVSGRSNLLAMFRSLHACHETNLLSPIPALWPFTVLPGILYAEP